MFRFLAKRLTCFVVITAWFVLANHCILHDAFAKASTEKSHHCHDNGKSSGKDSSHHNRCQDKGCCQPVLNCSTDSISISQSHVFETHVVNILNFIYKADLDFEEKFANPDLARGPPQSFKLVLLAYSLSPNAPPLASI